MAGATGTCLTSAFALVAFAKVAKSAVQAKWAMRSAIVTAGVGTGIPFLRAASLMIMPKSQEAEDADLSRVLDRADQLTAGSPTIEQYEEALDLLGLEWQGRRAVFFAQVTDKEAWSRPEILAAHNRTMILAEKGMDLLFKKLRKEWDDQDPLFVCRTQEWEGEGTRTWEEAVGRRIGSQRGRNEDEPNERDTTDFAAYHCLAISYNEARAHAIRINGASFGPSSPSEHPDGDLFYAPETLQSNWRATYNSWSEKMKIFVGHFRTHWGANEKDRFDYLYLKDMPS